MLESETFTITVSENSEGERLDLFLSKNFESYSRSMLQRLIRSGLVMCDGRICRSVRHSVQCGMEIVIEVPPPDTPFPEPESIPLDVIHEDESLMVINKSPGMVVHPSYGNPSGTVVNALLGRYDNFAHEFGEDTARPGIVHRLDKDTSGCLVIAKTENVRRKLMATFAERAVEKTYLALTWGIPKPANGEIKTLIGRHPVNRKKMAVLGEGGKEAVTRYETIQTASIDASPVALVKVNILTGRTHQIRVHLAHIKAPVLGDRTYGGRQRTSARRQLLHAWKLAFKHPETHEQMLFTAPIPDDFAEMRFVSVALRDASSSVSLDIGGRD